LQAQRGPLCNRRPRLLHQRLPGDSVIGLDSPFTYGVMGSLSRKTSVSTSRSSTSPINRISSHSSVGSQCSPRVPDALRLKVMAHLRDHRTRPWFDLERTDHPLALEHHEGISRLACKRSMNSTCIRESPRITIGCGCPAPASRNLIASDRRPWGGCLEYDDSKAGDGRYRLYSRRRIRRRASGGIWARSTPGPRRRSTRGPSSSSSAWLSCAAMKRASRRLSRGCELGLGGRARVRTSAPHATQPRPLRTALGVDARGTPVADRDRARLRRLRSTEILLDTNLSPDTAVRREHRPRGAPSTAFDEARDLGAHPTSRVARSTTTSMSVRQPRAALTAVGRGRHSRGRAPRCDARSVSFFVEFLRRGRAGD
jgi:hypothetical protein